MRNQLDLFNGIAVPKKEKELYTYAVRHHTREDFYFECYATDANDAVRKCYKTYKDYWSSFREARSLLRAKGLFYRAKKPGLLD